MDISNLEIIAPEGMEYYIENNQVKFRPKQTKLTYDDITKELFKNNCTYYINIIGKIETLENIEPENCSDLNNCTSELQAKKLLAINQLMNVAKYLNGDWQPNWYNPTEYKFYIYIDKKTNTICTSGTYACNCLDIYFKSREIAQQAIEILGEETIKLALTTNW